MLPNAPHTHTLASAEFEKAEPKVYHQKGMDEWGTPLPLFQQLNKEFGFTLDVAANEKNHKCLQYLTKEMQALDIDWWGRVWMNPPFSLTVAFLVKMVNELKKGNIEVGVALIAARPDTQVSHYCSSYAGETRYLKGRLSFEVHPTEMQLYLIGCLAKAMADGFVPGGQFEDGSPMATWKSVTEEIGLPKTVIQKLLKNPHAGPHEVAVNAPFPSAVLIFDRRPEASVVYWDWKKGLRTSYAYSKKLGTGAFLNAPGPGPGSGPKPLLLFGGFPGKEEKLFKVKPLLTSLASFGKQEYGVGSGSAKLEPQMTFSGFHPSPQLVDLEQMEKLLLDDLAPQTIPPGGPGEPEPASPPPTAPPPDSPS